jgi:hypothetical protein
MNGKGKTMQFPMMAQPAEGVSMDQVRPHVREEAAELWRLWGNEHLRSIHSRADRSGIVAMLEADDISAAQEVAQSLPMVKMGLLAVEVIPSESLHDVRTGFRTGVNSQET